VERADCQRLVFIAATPRSNTTANITRYGTYSTTEAVEAGLDLEMPGPSRWRTVTLSHAVNSGKMEMTVLDSAVRNVLCAVEKAQESGIPENAPETTRNTKEDRLLLRRTAANSIVLLKNEGNILPLKANRTVWASYSVPLLHNSDF
jgi:beta-glucosidase